MLKLSGATKSMTVDPEDIAFKFGKGYVANDQTFLMGIDCRFTRVIAERFKGHHVLETCTGAGFTTIALAQQAAHVVTVEINLLHQEQARKNVKLAGLMDKVTFINGDILSQGIIEKAAPFDSAFLDPDWAVTGSDHIFKFKHSNTRPPADTLLGSVQRFTENIALVLPPFIDTKELDGIPQYELQSLFFGKNRELYCLYLGNLARAYQETEIRL